MAATQQNGPDEPASRQSRWTEPDPGAVTAQINKYSQLTNRDFTSVLVAFLSSTEKDQVAAYAIRSPELARKSRRLIGEVAEVPEKFLDQGTDESANAYRERRRRLRLAAEHEGQLLYFIAAALVARRGHLPPEPNPRARARRRLADQHPEVFLQYVREEQRKDEERIRRQRAERAAARAAEA
ncbi:hypothetical protein [Streptomyces sp. NPDC097619]|uniref:hypothetical protein n=1 Tax=Streptomyces sp. NPDC097619 TaxID=3157228 RepID=UPI00332D3639